MPELTYAEVAEHAKSIGFSPEHQIVPFVYGTNLTLKRLNHAKKDEFLSWLRERETYPSGISIHPTLNWMRLKLNDKLLPFPHFEEEVKPTALVY